MMCVPCSPFHLPFCIPFPVRVAAKFQRQHKSPGCVGLGRHGGSLWATVILTHLLVFTSMSSSPLISHFCTSRDMGTFWGSPSEKLLPCLCGLWNISKCTTSEVPQDNRLHVIILGSLHVKTSLGTPLPHPLQGIAWERTSLRFLIFFFFPIYISIPLDLSLRALALNRHCPHGNFEKLWGQLPQNIFSKFSNLWKNSNNRTIIT